MSTIHPARTMIFEEVANGIRDAQSRGLVTEQAGDDGLRIYCYSNAAVYDRQWTPFTLMARGLVLDHERAEVVATPFPKFFNYGERGEPIPAMPFEVFDKLDGSLIILFWHRGQWKTATKGAFRSPQALWAAQRIASADCSNLVRGTTYLLEACYPENRIVVHYDEPSLVLLAAYDEGGIELSYDALQDIAATIGWKVARRHSFQSVSDLIESASHLTAQEEGFVLRFENGHRLKVKGEEYRRIHALITRVTPLAMWEAMLAGDDLAAVRRDLPEEFWGDFDLIIAVLKLHVAEIVATVEREAAAVAHLSDKEVGLLDSLSHKAFTFAFRKHGDLLQGKSRASLFRTIRPTGNHLDGYTPSYAITRIAEEAA